MVDDRQRAKAEAFRSLHSRGIFVLPNAWDAGSASMIAAAGADSLFVPGLLDLDTFRPSWSGHDSRCGGA